MRLPLFILPILVAIFVGVAKSSKHYTTFRFRPEGNEYVQVNKRRDSSEDFHKAYFDTLDADYIRELGPQQLELLKMKYGIQYN